MIRSRKSLMSRFSEHEQFFIKFRTIAIFLNEKVRGNTNPMMSNKGEFSAKVSVSKEQKSLIEKQEHVYMQATA